MEPLKPRDKVTQHMTRDGLTLDNQTTGESVNVSSREAEQEYTCLLYTSPAQNCLPDRKSPAGMCGAMKWTAIFPCPYQKRGDFLWLM